MVRKIERFSWVIMGVVLAISLIFSVVFALSAAADTPAVVTVENLSGDKGSSIQVAVTAENVKDLVGGGFTIFYDNEIAIPISYEAGDLLTGMDSLMPSAGELGSQQKDGSVRITWVAYGDPPTTLDSGTLAVITFELLEQGETDLTLDQVSIGLLVDGQNVNPSIVEEDGSIQVTVPLDQVDTPTLTEEGIVTWSDVDNADSYKIILYRDGVEVGTWNEAPGEESYDVLNTMRTLGEGSYTAKVQAKGAGLFTDGPESNTSNSQTVERLGTVSKPNFVRRLASWDTVSNATAYDVQLYKVGEEDDELVASHFINYLDPEYNFYREMRDAGVGEYYVKVKALGANLFLDGDNSEASDMQEVKPAVVTFGIQQFTEDGTVEIPVIIENASHMAGGQFVLTYDPAIVNPVGITKGDLLSDMEIMVDDVLNATLVTADLQHSDSSLGVVWASGITVEEAGLGPNGVLFTIEFEITGQGETSLEVSDLLVHDAYEDESEPIPSTWVDGNIFSVRYGDVNDDGNIDFWDARLVMQHFANITTLTGRDHIAADVNGDEVVDFWDARLIMQHFAGLIDKFPVEGN